MKAKNLGGRPSKILHIDREQVKSLYIAGLTDEQVAEFLKIDKATLNRWKNRFPEFRASIKDWKIKADTVIVNSLFHRARGYSHSAIKFFQCGKKVIKVPYIEHYPPDPTSLIFWLKNRQPEKWRDKHEVDDPAMRELVKIFLPAKDKL